MAMNLFGHGFALSYDFVIQGAPAVSAGAAGITTTGILHQAWPVFWVMGIVTVGSAYLLNRDEMEGRGLRLTIQTGEADTPKGGNMALLMAILTPLAFVGVIVLMLVFDLKGGDATSMVSFHFIPV